MPKTGLLIWIWTTWPAQDKFKKCICFPLKHMNIFIYVLMIGNRHIISNIYNISIIYHISSIYHISIIYHITHMYITIYVMYQYLHIYMYTRMYKNIVISKSMCMIYIYTHWITLGTVPIHTGIYPPRKPFLHWEEW